VGLGHLRNFLKLGLKASKDVGGIITCLEGFISYSMIGDSVRIMSARDSCED
jgi:hypothetical protein